MRGVLNSAPVLRGTLGSLPPVLRALSVQTPTLSQRHPENEHARVFTKFNCCSWENIAIMYIGACGLKSIV